MKLFNILNLCSPPVLGSHQGHGRAFLLSYYILKRKNACTHRDLLFFTTSIWPQKM